MSTFWVISSSIIKVYNLFPFFQNGFGKLAAFVVGRNIGPDDDGLATLSLARGRRLVRFLFASRVVDG